MKTLLIIGVALLLAGCTTTPRQNSVLTAEQAQKVAIQLVNEKSFVLYQCRPFDNRQSAKFVEGRWVWADRRGYGRGDIEARVELAANGSTNDVDLKLLDSRATRTGGFF